MTPFLITSSNLTRPGNIGRPAASALLQPKGRSKLLERLNLTAMSTLHDELPVTPGGLLCQVSYNIQVLLSKTITCLSPLHDDGGQFKYAPSTGESLENG